MKRHLRRLANRLLPLRLFLDRLLHSPFFNGADTRLFKSRFAHDHEQEPLLGGTTPAFGRSLHIGVGAYDRVLRISPTQTRPEIGGVLMSAPPRGGKSLGATVDLLTFQGSVIVNDTKGELRARTAGFRATFSKVITLDFRGRGNRFDPLANCSTEEDFREMAMHLLRGPKQREDDPFLRRAINMLTALFQAGHFEGYPLLPYSANLLHLGPEEVALRLQTVSERFHLREGNNLTTRFLDKPLHTADFSDRYFQSAWSTLTATAAPLITETVLKSLTGSDFTIEELRCGTKELRDGKPLSRPVTIYLIFPESRLHGLHPLVRFIWGSLLDQLIQLYDDRLGEGCQDVLALIDEAGAAPLPSLPRYSATAAGRRIILKVIVQDHNQLKSEYGEYNATTIINNMDTQIFLRQNGTETAEYLQKRTGFQSAFAHSISVRGDHQTGEGQMEQAVPLVTIPEMAELDDTDCIILHRNLKPIRAKRMDPRNYPTLTASMAMPPPELPTLASIPEILPVSQEAELPQRFGPVN